MSRSAIGKIIFPLCLFFFLTGAFVLLQPKIAVGVFPSLQAQRLKNFLSLCSGHECANGINAQRFWEFREFSGPGSFTYNPETVDIANGLVLKKFDPTTTQRIQLLGYTSPYIVSWDGLVRKESNWQTYVSPDHLTPQQKQHILFQDAATLIYQEDLHKIKIIFTKDIDNYPTDDMMTTNGFFQYTDDERQLLKNYYWLDETWVYTN